MPRVSVVIPTYNRAGYLSEAVASVLAQTYRDFEVIIVDDGSIDNTPEVVASFRDAHIRYFYQENRGVSAAMNTGILASTADYIAVLDSDDVLVEEALQKSVAFLDQHPEAGYCFGQSYTIDENGRPLRRSPRGPKVTFVRDGREEIAHALLGERSIGFLVRRSCFQEVGLYNTELPMSEDWDVFIRLAKRYAVGHLAEPLYKWRSHHQQMTSQSNVKVVQNAHTAVLESVFEDADLGALYGHLRGKAYFGLYCLLARMSSLAGHRGIGLLYLLKAIKTCPESLCEIKGLSLWINSTKNFLPWRLRRIIVRMLMALKLR